MAERIGRLSYLVSLVVKAFACFGLLAMSVIIAWQVFARYALNASPAWAEQAALLLMIWYVLFAAAAGVREGFHIRIAAFVDLLAPGPRRLVLIAAHLLVGAFGLAMVVWGIGLVADTWEHVIPTLSLPRGVAYLPMLPAGALIFLFSLEHAAAELRQKRIPAAWS
jgi:TRAP-type C4-dicarboxylate transport system permease small subunit